MASRAVNNNNAMAVFGATNDLYTGASGLGPSSSSAPYIPGVNSLPSGHGKGTDQDAWETLYGNNAAGAIMRVVDPGGFFAPKPKAYEPTKYNVNVESFFNPSQDWRSEAMTRAFGAGPAGPTAGYESVNTSGFGQGMDKYGMGLERYAAGLGLSNEAIANNRAAREGQVNALGLLGTAAEGNAPSVAEYQRRKGLNEALTSQLALANSARGGAGAGVAAQRQAAFNAADMTSKAANDAAMLRAQEMSTARGQYMTGTGQLSEADRAAQALGYQQGGMGLSAAGLGLTAATTGLQPEVEKARLNQQITLANQQAGLGQQQLNQAGSLGYLGALGAVDTRTMEGWTEYEKLMAEQETARQRMITDQQAGVIAAQQKQQGATLSGVGGILGSVFGGGGGGGGGMMGFL